MPFVTAELFRRTPGEKDVTKISSRTKIFVKPGTRSVGTRVRTGVAVKKVGRRWFVTPDG